MTMKLHGRQNSSEMNDRSESIRITLAESDLAAIRRLRYRIYIEEQLKPLPWADHVIRELPDRDDNTATHFISMEEGEARAAARVHFRVAISPELLSTVGLDGLLDDITGEFGFCSKLVVERAHRGHWLAAAVMRSVYQEGRRRGASFCLSHCVKKLVPYYESIGLRRTGRPFDDGYVGMQFPMVLVVEDHDHFKGRRSFLASAARSYENQFGRASELNTYFKAKLQV